MDDTAKANAHNFTVRAREQLEKLVREYKGELQVPDAGFSAEKLAEYGEVTQRQGDRYLLVAAYDPEDRERGWCTAALFDWVSGPWKDMAGGSGPAMYEPLMVGTGPRWESVRHVFFRESGYWFCPEAAHFAECAAVLDELWKWND